MEDLFEKLTNELLSINDSLSYNQARTWIEHLWEDFETTRARSGRNYLGHEMTEKIVRQWIVNYGETLHEFLSENPRFSDLNQDRGYKH